MDEQILEVIPVNWKKGLFKSEPWAVIVTDKEMLFAKWTQELFKKESLKRKEEAKDSGGGKVKQFFSQMTTGFSYYNKYLEMKPDEILSENNENFSLTPNDVLDIKMKKGRSKYQNRGIVNVRINIGSQQQMDELETPHELIINAKTGKIILNFNTNFEKAKSALATAFYF
jgi:hypothetical protein